MPQPTSSKASVILLATLSLAVLVLAVFPAMRLPRAEETQKQAASPARTYQESVRPLLVRYCEECHSAELAEAEIDLSSYGSLEQVRRTPETWIRVREMLDSGQMPPKDARQPTERELAVLQTWVRDFLTDEARARAGDPGPVILRRLNNAEYTYTVRDLTEVNSLDPTREFPVDGAAGEGFTNAGSAQAMSPAMVTKYLDAGKEVADHVMLLPDGIRFSPYTSRRDQTDQLLKRIQDFYRQFTTHLGAEQVNQSGYSHVAEKDGRLPLKRYLEATVVERDALLQGSTSIETVARQRSLNARYLSTLWTALTSDTADPESYLLHTLRHKWRQTSPEQLDTLVAEIETAQQAFWKFNSVGQIGRENGPASWMEPVSPILAQQEVRFPLAGTANRGDIRLYLVQSVLGNENSSELVQWQSPRIVFPASDDKPAPPPVPLRDVRLLTQQVPATIAQAAEQTRAYLEALQERHAAANQGEPAPGTLDALAEARDLNPGILRRWSQLSGLGDSYEVSITGQFTERLTKVQGYEAINGWGAHQTPSLLANRSEEPITFLTLTVPARGVTVHPSPSLESIVAWRSPLRGHLKIEGRVADADDKCGNGAAWRVELRTRVQGVTVLARGEFDNGGEQAFEIEPPTAVAPGDALALVVSARGTDHTCDTTHITWQLTETGGEQRRWDLARDIVDRVLEANPLPDRYGNLNTWHFCSSAASDGTSDAVFPADSALGRWKSAVLQNRPAAEIHELAERVERAFTTSDVEALSRADRVLRDRFLDWSGPWNWLALSRDSEHAGQSSGYGMDPAAFGTTPLGGKLPPTDLCLPAPAVIEVRLPDIFQGAELVANCRLLPPDDAPDTDRAPVQVRVTAEKPAGPFPTLAGPVLVRGEAAEARTAKALKQFRDLFPPALCYLRIVPVDEVVTLILFYREDEHLQRLMLDQRQKQQLEQLWDELLYVSREPIALTVALEQITEFATQDRPDLVPQFRKLEQPINERAEQFRQRLRDSEPAHLEGVLQFADRAWRRPLEDDEREGLKAFYHHLRSRELAHEEAIRLTLTRVLTSPAFLYKLEQPPAGPQAAAVNDLELATRLSYFLWSSLPDTALREAAESGALAADTGSDESSLAAHTDRMLRDPRIRRLAIHFACQWLHLRNFDQNDDKNEQLYPEFAELRGDMYEETVRFFEDMFRNDGSILDTLKADHTFLNQSLARYYGIDGVEGSRWRRVEAVGAHQRGGVLGMASFLASQSGASRTSPILRGNWVFETLLGERLPRPPANVPVLPEQVPEELTARQLIERHSSVAECAKCHVRIDPYGFALEQFDAIGRLRDQRVDVRTTLFDGTRIEGPDGLRDYLATTRRDDFVRQFCRKLLGYALGREVQLSDEILLQQMSQALAENDFRFSVAVHAVVQSPQFRKIRGNDLQDSAQVPGAASPKNQ